MSNHSGVPVARFIRKPINIPALADRVYAAGKRFTAEDFREGLMKPGVVVVSPIRPPVKSAGGLFMPGQYVDVPGQLCILHRVEAVGELEPGSLPMQVGDVVACMLSFLDPMDEKGDLLNILADKVVNILGHDVSDAPKEAA